MDHVNGKHPCSLLEACILSNAARPGFNDDLPNMALVSQMNCEIFVCSHRVYDFNLLYHNVNLFCLFFPGKLPKNYNSEVDPDPERWIPKRERTYYKGKRQKKGAAVGGYKSG